MDVVSPPAEAEAAGWEEIGSKQKAAAAERERLLLLHMPQVRLIAESLRLRLRFAMEFEVLGELRGHRPARSHRTV